MIILTEKEKNELVSKAFRASKNSYSPYSGYKIGAAIMTDERRIFTGTNIENSTYGATVCAERVALFKAVSEGYRSFSAIAVASEDVFPVPCGICRQVIAEFCNDITVLVAEEKGKYREYSLSELLPDRFICTSGGKKK